MQADQSQPARRRAQTLDAFGVPGVDLGEVGGIGRAVFAATANESATAEQAAGDKQDRRRGPPVGRE